MDFIDVTHDGSTLHHLSYQYDSFGNLIKRSTTYGAGASEDLLYDDLHRLQQSSREIGGGAAQIVDIAYDPAGNITHKSDKADQYVYSATQPNRLESIKNSAGTILESYGYDLNGNLTANGNQNLVYNAFNKPLSIEEGTGGPLTQFSYGADLMRYRQMKPGGERVYYLDKLMEIESFGSVMDFRHYLGDVVILTKTGDLDDPNPSIDYIHRDRLGSIVNITDHTGLIEEGRGFDAFGKPRNGDWSDKAPPILGSNITERGFTGHEHLDDHQLIHMNGRGYDYGLGRFLSVDPIIQAPGNSQSLNPYSYIMNNPLSGTDPTGYCSAETGTRIKDCVNVNVQDADTGEILGTKSMNTMHSNFAGNVANYAASKLGSGASITGVTGTFSNGSSVSLGPQQNNMNSNAGSQDELGSPAMVAQTNIGTSGANSNSRSQTNGPTVDNSANGVLNFLFPAAHAAPPNTLSTAQRRQVLATVAGLLSQASTRNVITDLDALAHIGEVAAALGATGVDFVDDIGATLSATTTANVGQPTGPVPLFIDSGFRTTYQDGSNQVRHFAGALVAGGAFGSGFGQILNTGREAISPPGARSLADVRLGNQAAHLGHLFATGQLSPTDFGRIVRRRLGP